MGQIIKKFDNDFFLEYDRGKFDDWCVYLTNSAGQRYAPRDIDYFNQIKHFAKKYGKLKIYNDYVKIYNLTKKTVEEANLSAITEIASSYGEDATEIDIIFSILYMAMIAEERKENTRLGKRIKRLGIHMLLIEDYSTEYSANFTRGKKWLEIDELCRERGF